MTLVHAVLGVATLALTIAAAALGSWRWWQVEPSPLFWRLLRAAQIALVVEAAIGGVLLALGERPERSLHYVYGLVPLGVSFLAEQLRISSAEAVLEARGLEGSESVRALPADQQRSVVLQIVRRELGVMALAAVVMVGLELRAIL